MLKIKQYVKAESLEQAYELNQKKTNRIVGGMLWLKMSTAQIQTAIDLSGLGLDQIEETEDAWKIGCMVSLRDLELHEGLNELSCNMIRESVRSIVGVQFRNLATIGGSIFGRFGFSQIQNLCLYSLDSKLDLNDITFFYFRGSLRHRPIDQDSSCITGFICNGTPFDQAGHL